MNARTMRHRHAPHLRDRLLAVAGMLLVGCSDPAPPAARSGDSAAAKPGDQAAAGSVLISAAASCTDLLNALIEKFHEQSSARVRLNAGPSSGLATQIINGAPADLFLSANSLWADRLDDEGLAVAKVPLLTNRLALVVPDGNPAGVATPEDLLNPAVIRLALAGPSVPAGIYAEQVLQNLDLFDELQSRGTIVRGQDVRSTLSYVERGEADAGIVYATDVPAARGVVSVYEFDPSLHDEIVYVLVRIRSDTPNPAADEFFRFLQSAEARSIYTEFGFIPLTNPDQQ